MYVLLLLNEHFLKMKNRVRNLKNIFLFVISHRCIAIYIARALQKTKNVSSNQLLEE